MPVKLMPLSADAAFLAGGFYHAYRLRGGTRARILADFIVAAQAQLGADRLLTTDKRFFGSSFPKLLSVSPADLLS
jgi:predicted nucleic acid-binding protein